ncbi:hypothetical protein GDO78_019622 [Eleutherodactylus coqui]|uniref:Uncharacterized protein n=1 Tax=Eleutherodactylus coqui TaxID=57060 RepID=A0A8J6B5U5_ELECQ|nr:hypothetical protein GDO78_019622 [Eleutherodactylus coqui]
MRPVLPLAMIAVTRDETLQDRSPAMPYHSDHQCYAVSPPQGYKWPKKKKVKIMYKKEKCKKNTLFALSLIRIKKMYKKILNPTYLVSSCL